MARLRLKRTEAAPLWGIPNSTLEPWEKSTSNAVGAFIGKRLCGFHRRITAVRARGRYWPPKRALDAKGRRGYVHIDADEIRILLPEWYALSGEQMALPRCQVAREEISLFTHMPQ